MNGQCPAGVNELIVTLAFEPHGTSFRRDLSTSGMNVHFASATCANDIVDGILAAVPEPGTLLLLGSGLIVMGAVTLRRFAPM